MNHFISLDSKFDLENTDTFQSHFSLRPDQIVVAADKNIGFVCMDVDDYLSQYERINLQQHFGKVDVPEKLYIEYIHNFVIQAANNIPHELSLLVKKSDFTLPGQILNLRLVCSG